ncbi:MAG TPA: STAS domain-containing protein [Microbacteriaceae bacterium]|nr:STAS domain-containing protein [Microbacteriaceae bacterium]
MTIPEFSVEIKQLPGQARIVCAGELDLGTADQLKTAVLSALGMKSDAILVDLEEATFVDSSGLRALLEVIQECRDLGVAIQVRPGTALRRLLELVQVEVPLES